VTDAPALVRIRDVNLTVATAAGPATLLRDVSLTIGRGARVGLVGESGSGKSTLAALLLRLDPPNLIELSGSALFDGLDLITAAGPALAAHRGAGAALIAQDPASALNPVLTIGTQACDVARRRRPERSRGKARQDAEAMLARVGLDPPERFARAYPHELSGGQRQRALIAMALLAEPRLILADEPTTALDATVAAGVMRLLDEIGAGFGGSILLVSHDLALVASFCDDLAVMYAGTVVETGPALELLSDPRHPYTTALVACARDEEGGQGPLASIPGEVPRPTEPEPGCPFAPRCPLALDDCRAGLPDLREVEPGRRVACVRA
jgi:peptide/nickel transport system ATP-binding protein